MPPVETVLKELIEILSDMTRDWDTDFSGGISGKTRLVADLGFESIDVVMLIGEIHRHYNRRNLPFERLFIRDGGYVDDLELSALAEFVHKELGSES